MITVILYMIFGGQGLCSLAAVSQQQSSPFITVVGVNLFAGLTNFIQIYM